MGFFMKNFTEFFGSQGRRLCVVTLILVIAFLVAGCSTDGGDDNTATDGTSSGHAIYTSVTIIQPTSNVEIVGTTPTTFYGTGAIFTVTVQGENNPTQTVTWTRTGDNLNAETKITDGILTVNVADHGKDITITATSTVDTTKKDSVTIKAVICLPSDFYGKWVMSTDPTAIRTISDTKVKANQSNGNWIWNIDTVTPVFNSNNGTNKRYPVGFAFAGIVTENTSSVATVIVNEVFSQDYFLSSSDINQLVVGNNVYGWNKR